MRKVDYERPATIDEAVRALTREQPPGVSARLIAGGTDLMGVINLNILPTEIETVVSIRGLGMDGITPDGGITPGNDSIPPSDDSIAPGDDGITIGAATTLSDIAGNADIKRRLPLLADAARSVASPQIRHIATIGGNICQEPRCWYYRYPGNRFPCMRKGGDNCNAMTGNNAYHSVLGGAKVRTSPCSTGCPNETDIPAYFDAVRKGDLTEAARIFTRVNPLGAVTGRVCPHECQSSCNRNEFDEAVGIRNIERVIGDHALNHFEEVSGKDFNTGESGKSVGIIGAGPAGLTAAWYLRQRGHAVTVYDRNAEIGGMLRYAIPAYRLPTVVMDKIKSVYDKIGVSFVLGIANAHTATSRTPEEYLKNHDAVLIAGGAWADNEATFEGSEHALSGLSFLYNLRDGECGERSKPGDKVVVIGGGNVAVDVAVSARRLGCDATILYRRSRAEMPAYDEEIEDALSEGVKLITNVTPVKITTTNAGVNSVTAAACLSGEGGGRNARLAVDSENTIDIEADAVIMAIGQKVSEDLFPAAAPQDKSGRITVTAETGATNKKGIFAAGDAVTGPATVVEAIAGGRKAAHGIHAYLTGESTGALQPDTASGEPLRFDPSCIAPSKPAAPKAAAYETRTLDGEDVASLSDPDTRAEAARCFNCGCVAVTPSDIAPALVALGADIATTTRRIPADEFFRAGIASSTALEAGEIVTSIFIPYPPPDAAQKYQKFRTRKAIDFPVASVASVISGAGGTIESARIVLGGAAPTPYRAEAAEATIIGKPRAAETAEAAGRAAVEDMCGLAENGYKIKVFKALVRRAVAGR
ncbi:MAG: FAD-dependent oxidoreductase [Clostridiales Family XIII bacterium]|jgi:NADPH-dependent glutamate synthase beta subunit-like oxidoreductase/CO/xanthine dehydrogenase FAD-binding subunit|nr:FAD-dependent oxidoreductase [Clostridiales Family XIII bacterium]